MLQFEAWLCTFWQTRLEIGAETFAGSELQKKKKKVKFMVK